MSEKDVTTDNDLSVLPNKSSFYGLYRSLTLSYGPYGYRTCISGITGMALSIDTVTKKYAM